jgi:hypothetical protein
MTAVAFSVSLHAGAGFLRQPIHSPPMKGRAMTPSSGVRGRWLVAVFWRHRAGAAGAVIVAPPGVANHAGLGGGAERGPCTGGTFQRRCTTG